MGWASAVAYLRLKSAARWAARLALLVSPLFLNACLITAPGVYFASSDFVQPKVLSGVWQSAPAEGTDKTAEVSYLQVKPVENGLHRATPLFKDGRIDVNNDTVDFGVVDLGSGNYVVATTETEGDGTKSEFLGLKAEEDKLTLIRFDGGGLNNANQVAFAQALSQNDLSRDASDKGDTRLAGVVTKDKIKALFTALMADPAQYGGNVTVYTKAVGIVVKQPPKLAAKPRHKHRRRHRHH
ncbi:MAG TPA: hypothetical protein VEH07_06800 [Alphaproteobacteria bacterium]|nr:hypothetical protein [Alphaproteobacteria bacterium]